MNFEDEIKKTMECFANPVKISADSKTYTGFAFFRQLAKNEEDLLEESTQDEIGLINSSKFFVWLYTKEKLKKIDYIIHNETKYLPLSQKFNPETSCLELILN